LFVLERCVVSGSEQVTAGRLSGKPTLVLADWKGYPVRMDVVLAPLYGEDRRGAPSYASIPQRARILNAIRAVVIAPLMVHSTHHGAVTVPVILTVHDCHLTPNRTS
jgi:hypothetical protein